MHKTTHTHTMRKGLQTAGLIVLCLCGSFGLAGCAATEAVGGIFSFNLQSFFQALSDHYAGNGSTSNSSTSGNNSNTAADAIDPADLREVITTITYLPTTGDAGSVAQSKSASVWVDYTNAGEGYVMVQYLGSHTGQIKLQIAGPDGTTYTYNLTVGASFEAFPLTGGSGSYTLNTYEQDSGTSYYLVDSVSLTAEITNELSPYLYPNQYVDYTQDSAVVALSVAAATNVTSELALVENVYYSVMDTINYDYDFAELVAGGGLSSYIPDLDEVIETEAGICFDYAALMVAMLRIQEVPAKLVIGYAGEAYHAWINVYTEEQGWVDKAVYFNGESWSLMDPTYADTAGSNDYVGDGENYTQKYVY